MRKIKNSFGGLKSQKPRFNLKGANFKNEASKMNENITLVFHGFLNLTGKEKLQMVEAINDYFDSNDREPIREQNETSFAEIDWNAAERKCKCCGR